MTHQDTIKALEGLMTIARMYHKGEAPGHLDACELPDNCGQCLAMRKCNAALELAEEEARALDPSDSYLEETQQ